MGEASTKLQAELHVKQLIDWFLSQSQRRAMADDDPTESD